MGNQCVPENPNQHYYEHFKDVNFSELKSQWSTLKIYNIRKIFDKASCLNKDLISNNSFLHYQDFCLLFPEFIRYEDSQKQKIYRIFDREQRGVIDWNSFYSSISMCYFSSDVILSTIMFMIFDEDLQKRLKKHQLTLLLDLNAIYLKQSETLTEIETEQVEIELLKGRNFITFQDWIRQAGKYFDFNQFRNLFNIFKEEKMQKELVQNFFTWNELYDKQQQKYISYIINYKWFQSWKTYVQLKFNIHLNIQEKNPMTMKSFKTKKSLKTNNSNKSFRKNNENNVMKRIKFENGDLNQCMKLEGVKNYDMVHSAIGERPDEIYNYFLEGEFEEVLKPGLVQNRDYVLVSEKVWRYLSEIYDGHPQFRRTGFDQIQLYPKIIKIYSDVFKNEISYCTEIIREVSIYITIEDLLTKSIELSKASLPHHSIYYRTTQLPFWQEITNINEMFSELTSLVIIFLIYLPRNSAKDREFRSRYLYSEENAEKKVIKLGDTLRYVDKNGEKEVIFMNKNIEGKFIIHFIGDSYGKDQCLSEKEFYKFCKARSEECVVYDSNPHNQSNKNVEKEKKKRRGIQDIKNLSFITSTILHFLENPNFRDTLGRLSNINTKNTAQNTEGEQKKPMQTTSMSIIVGYIGQLLRAQRKVETKDILYLVNNFLPNYADFDISLIFQFYYSFTKQLKEEAKILDINDVVSDYEFGLKIRQCCGRCGKETEEFERNQCVLSVSIPENAHGYFYVNFVPFNLTLNSQAIKKYGFELNKNATLKEYKKKFDQIADLRNRRYILVEVYGHTIIKNYAQVNEDLKLNKIHLRQEDCIFAYQICMDFQRFVKDHYTFSEKGSMEISSKEMKIDEIIDCNNHERGWIPGKIIDKDIVAYTYKERLKVLHRISKSQCFQICYEIQRGNIAYFPSQSYRNCDQYYLRLVQRVFNEANNKMELCNIPLVIVLSNWMRWKQFNYIIFLQVKKFIADSYKFNKKGENEDNYRMFEYVQSNYLKEATKAKAKRFREYLYGKNFPYKLNFIDYSGHCAICYKFVKTVIYKGQSQNYCQGCSLNPSEPICWQIRVTDLMIAIDWASPERTKAKSIKNHTTYISMEKKMKKDTTTIESCVNNFMDEIQLDSEMLCCNIPTSIRVRREVVNLPRYLIVHLKRIVWENGFKQTIKKPVNFHDETIVVEGIFYELVGLITLNGHQSHLSYRSFIKGKQRWYMYNGEKVQIWRKDDIDSCCTLVFYYRKIENEAKQSTKGRKEMKKSVSMNTSMKSFEGRGLELDEIEDDGEISRVSLINIQ